MGNGAANLVSDVVLETEQDERQWVRAAQKDLQAAGRLYDRYYERIYRYIFHSTLDRALTEDLTANVFLAAFRNLGCYRWQRIPFGAWLYRIATNELRMAFRQSNRHSMESLEERYDTGHEPVSTDADVLSQVAVEESCSQVHQALGKLKPKYREVIVLRYFEDKSYVDISIILGRRLGTVKSQLARGLTQLQGILRHMGVLPD